MQARVAQRRGLPPRCGGAGSVSPFSLAAVSPARAVTVHAGGLQQRRSQFVPAHTDDPFLAVMLDRGALEPVKLARHVAQVSCKSTRWQSSLSSCAAPGRRTEHMAADRFIRRVIDRPRAHRRLDTC
jgi:hypothetical protein